MLQISFCLLLPEALLLSIVNVRNEFLLVKIMACYLV